MIQESHQEFCFRYLEFCFCNLEFYIENSVLAKHNSKIRSHILVQERMGYWNYGISSFLKSIRRTRTSYCSQSEWAFHAKFLHEKPIFFLLLAIFFAPLSLENSQYQKENIMRSLERANQGSFWLGSIYIKSLLNNIIISRVIE